MCSHLGGPFIMSIVQRFLLQCEPKTIQHTLNPVIIKKSQLASRCLPMPIRMFRYYISTRGCKVTTHFHRFQCDPRSKYSRGRILTHLLQAQCLLRSPIPIPLAAMAAAGRTPLRLLERNCRPWLSVSHLMGSTSQAD